MMTNLKKKFNFLDPNGGSNSKSLAGQVAMLEEKYSQLNSNQLRMDGKIKSIVDSANTLTEDKIKSLGFRLKQLEEMYGS